MTTLGTPALSLLLVAGALGACAAPSALPPPLPLGEPLSGESSEYRARLHRWGTGDTFRYVLERFVETKVGESVDTARHEHQVRYSARSQTLKGLVQVSVFVGDFEMFQLYFDAAGRLVDTSGPRPGAGDLAGALVGVWALLGRPWESEVLRAGEQRVAQVPIEDLSGFQLPDLELQLEGGGVARTLAIAYRLAGFRQLGGQRAAVIEAEVSNFLLKPLPMRLRDAGPVTVESVTGRWTYYLDTVRGSLFAAHSVTRIVGLARGQRFESTRTAVLRWRP